MDTIIRACAESDLAAVTAIYADAVIHGTASFEIDPPTDPRCADGARCLSKEAIRIWWPNVMAWCSAMLTQVPIEADRPIVQPSKIPFTSPDPHKAGASGPPFSMNSSEFASNAISAA